jgi:(2Fe-2S) ferredoxin
MSSTQKKSFCLIGQLEGYEVGESGKVRSLRLETHDGLQQIKLGKAGRLSLLQDVLRELTAQDVWLEVSGQQKVESDGTLKSLKAESLKVLDRSPDLPVADLPVVEDSALVQAASQRKKASDKILICQKSSCRKRGSVSVQRAIEQALDDRQLANQVVVKATGCLKQCSKGPNVVINKKSYRGVGVKDLPELLDQHFAQPANV